MIDLINHRALRDLRSFTRRTGQPTDPALLDLDTIRHVQKIEITEEHITIRYNETIERRYNANEHSYKEWEYKYNDDREFVAAIGRVIELARQHHLDMPDNVACPPGCAECCSGYEPFVSAADVQRIADHLGLSYAQTMRDYVNPRPSADGFVVGWLQKVDNDDRSTKCVFLKGSESGKYYCGIYEARPHDCRAFTPIGCNDVDEKLPREGEYPVGRPFRPRRATRK